MQLSRAAIMRRRPLKCGVGDIGQRIFWLRAYSRNESDVYTEPAANYRLLAYRVPYGLDRLFLAANVAARATRQREGENA